MTMSTKNGFDCREGNRRGSSFHHHKDTDILDMDAPENIATWLASSSSSSLLKSRQPQEQTRMDQLSLSHFEGNNQRPVPPEASRRTKNRNKSYSYSIVGNPLLRTGTIKNAPRVKQIRRRYGRPSRSPPKQVQFSTVTVHHHSTILGDNPSVSCGPPLALGWDCVETTRYTDIGQYEAATTVATLSSTQPQQQLREKRNPRQGKLSSQQREQILVSQGVDPSEIRSCLAQMLVLKHEAKQNQLENLMESQSPFHWMTVEHNPKHGRGKREHDLSNPCRNKNPSTVGQPFPLGLDPIAIEKSFAKNPVRNWRHLIRQSKVVQFFNHKKRRQVHHVPL